MLEAVGSGLALISFDIRYGSRIFIDEGKNGYRVPIGDVQKMADGIVRFCDHYNRHGENYARTVYDPTGKRCGKSWFSPTGQERIVENFITGDIVLDAFPYSGRYDDVRSSYGNEGLRQCKFISVRASGRGRCAFSKM